jgi:pimeloyl-ACP methyl ester carboxylesterase
MTTIQHGFADINGASLYYELAGSGPALVMLHGHLLDHRQWDDQFARFSADHTVVRYDGRGMGQSSFPAAPFSHAADLRALLDFLALDHAILMGCSGGGSACVDFALQHPQRMDGLILVDSGLDSYFAIDHGPPPPEVQAYFQSIQSGDVERAIEASLVLFTDGPRRKPEQVNPAVRERTRLMSAPLFSRRPPPEAVPQGLTPPAIERLGEIHAPTLVITGSEDAAMILDIANILAAGIPGAQAVVIADAGHHPNMEHPEQFNEIVAGFLSAIKQR